MFARKLSQEFQHLAKPYAQAAVERSAAVVLQKSKTSSGDDQAGCSTAGSTAAPSCASSSTSSAGSGSESAGLSSASALTRRSSGWPAVSPSPSTAGSAWPAGPAWPTSRGVHDRAADLLQEVEFCMMEKIWHFVPEQPSRWPAALPHASFLRCLWEFQNGSSQRAPAWCGSSSSSESLALADNAMPCERSSM
mmetsp:Transcript_82066/g.145462  ORF Transcript_82066/g.145462 Transcript_82066/m.145462 type:complete len:193 (-) Transcript_82066:38-616(-)